MPKNYSSNIICDSSSLISLVDTGMISLLYMLKERLNGQFLITDGIRDEIVSRPIQSKKYSFGAVVIQKAINDGVLVVLETEFLKKTAQEIMNMTNNTFVLNGKPLNLIHAGEAEILSLMVETNSRTLLIDEKTTRLFIENPEKLYQHLLTQYRGELKMNRTKLVDFKSMFKDTRILRSVELLGIGYMYGFFKQYGPLEKEALKAATYAVKFAGCGVSFEEIEEFLRKDLPKFDEKESKLGLQPIEFKE